MKKEIKWFFKVALKWANWKPSITEVNYQWADWNSYTGLQFEWYASTKDIDRTNDVVLPGAFEKSLEQYMENPIIFLQHNADRPIGSVIEATIDNNGLYIKGIVKSDKDNIFQDLRTGVIKTMSFGYRVDEYSQKTTTDANGDTIAYNEISALELFEISLVSVPMNPNAKIKSKEELLSKWLSDEEYAKYFQINKNDEYTLFKSISDAMKQYTKALEVNVEINVDTEDELDATSGEWTLDNTSGEWTAECDDICINVEVNVNTEDEDEWEMPGEMEDCLHKEEEIVENKEEVIENVEGVIETPEQIIEEVIETSEIIEEVVDNIEETVVEEAKIEDVVEDSPTEENNEAETVITDDEKPEVIEETLELEEIQETIDEIKSYHDMKIKTFDSRQLLKKELKENKQVKSIDIDCEVKLLDVPENYKNKIPTGAIYFEWIVSDESVNRYWEKVLSSAFNGQIKNFLKNGVILNSHDASQPIWLPLRVNVNKFNQVEVWGYVFDEYMWGRVAKWLFKWLSIWFIPTQYMWENKSTGEMINSKDFDTLLSECDTFEQFLSLIDEYMFVTTKLDWLEYSFCTTPANKWATIKLDYVQWAKNEYVEQLKKDYESNKNIDEVIPAIDETEIPENIAWDSEVVEEVITEPAENVEEVVEVVNEEIETVEPIEKQFESFKVKSMEDLNEKTKTIDEISNSMKSLQESFDSQTKALSDELNQLKSDNKILVKAFTELSEVTTKLYTSFKRITVDWALPYKEEAKKSVDPLLQTDLAKKLAGIVN